MELLDNGNGEKAPLLVQRQDIFSSLISDQMWDKPDIIGANQRTF